MKKSLLFTLALASMVPAVAQTSVSAVKKAPAAKEASLLKGAVCTEKKTLASGISLNVMRDSRGRLIKTLDVAARPQRINPAIAKAPAKAASEATPLSEDFEGWDGQDPSWLPQGWSTPSKGDSEGSEKWGVTPPSSYGGMLGGVTGNNLGINYSSDFLDELIVLPALTLGEDMSLSFDIFDDGLWHFSMDNIDWDTMEFIGDPELIFDQKVLVSTDGGQTWTVLKSLADEFADMPLEDLLNGMTNSMRRVSVSLADYAGQTVTLAIEYVGTDANMSAVDNVVIGKPALNVSYSNPFGTLYFGMSPESYVLNYSILTGPVFSPWTFYNTTYNYEGTYSWDYSDANSDWAVCDDPDELSVTYATDHSQAFTSRNNIYHMPVLKGSAPGFSEGSFSHAQYLQAGGKGEFEVTNSQTGEGVIVDFGLSCIDANMEGMATYTDALAPVFGYSPDVDTYWSDYTFQGDQDENNYAHLTHYMDYFFTGEAPMVINGVWTQALGKVKPTAVFTADIVPLTDEGTLAEPIATATCTGSAISVMETGDNLDWITLNFQFDEPVVMSSAVCDTYVVRISGFRDEENVEYFSPLLSETDNLDGYALGWVMKDMCYEGDLRTSLSPVYNYTGSLQSFYIMLDAEFPWLKGEDKASMEAGTTLSHPLDSYHHGDKLTVEGAPSWLTVTPAGRYGNATLEIAAAPEAEGKANLKILGPGVSHDLELEVKTASIKTIEAAEATSLTLYNLQGVRVLNPASGLYLSRDEKGRTRKVIVK